MLISIILIIAGFASLIIGANWLVYGASSLAKKHQISDLAVGLTIVAFGTSAPEMVVNAIASFNAYPDIVQGNIIGSNNFNLFIILGIAGIIYPISVRSSTVRWEIPISLAATILFFALANNFFLGGTLKISRIDGGVLFVGFITFLYYVFQQMKSEVSGTEITYKPKLNSIIWTLILLGLIGLITGGQLVVDNGIKIAKNLGASEKIIGLTIIAAGTSLPELITSIVAATKKNSDIAIGNVIGSNVFNILCILPISSFIKPIPFNQNFTMDLAILVGGTLVLLIAMFTGKRYILDRWESAILLSFYLIYTIYLVWKE